MCLKTVGGRTRLKRSEEGFVPRGYEEGRQWGPTTFLVGVAA